MSKIKNNLYAYFGMLGTHGVDIPGHSFYQLGLIDELCNKYGDGLPIDFFSYLPDDVIEQNKEYISCPYPDTQLGKIHQAFHSKLIHDQPRFKKVIDRIHKKEYNKLFLKARFRNMSTLAKKYMDAKRFESIINNAKMAGYDPSDLYIIDTDFSLPPEFLEYIKKCGINIIVPSINCKGVSDDFLKTCVHSNLDNQNSREHIMVHYGNLNFNNYKVGHEKNKIGIDCMKAFVYENKEGGYFDVMDKIHRIYQVGKLDNSIILKENLNLVLFPRKDREDIWKILEVASIMLNVTKDIYVKKHFVPARVYEAIIFGMIPVSYGFDFINKAMSFSNVNEFIEIIKFLGILNKDDFKNVYKTVALNVQNLND